MKKSLAWDPYKEAIHLLGMRMPHGRVQMMVADSKFYQRFPFEAVTRLRKKMGISQGKMAKLLWMSPRTFDRRKKEGRLTIIEAHEVFQIAFIMAYVLRKYSGLFVKAWLFQTRKDLGGKAPINYINLGVIGYKVLEKMLTARLVRLPCLVADEHFVWYQAVFYGKNFIF
jgi:uncharacterized protein (DUF2384 family)